MPRDAIKRPVPAALGLALLCLLASLALRSTYMDQPLDRDMGLYAAIAQNLSFDTLLYRDLVDHKQPLVYGIYWVIDTIAPQQVGALRVGAAIPPALAALLVLWALVPRAGWWRAGAAAALGLVVGASPLVQGGDLNTEHLMVGFAALAVLPALVFERSPSRWLPFAFGLLGGLVALTKASGAAIALVPLIPLIAGRDARGFSVARTIGQFAAGLALLPLLVLLAFAVAGAADDLWFGNITYNRRYVDQAPANWYPPELLEVVWLFLVAAGVGIVRLILHRGRDVLTLTVLAWLVAAYAGAQLSGRGFPHYYAPLVVPACILLCLAPTPRFEPRALARAGAVVAAIAAVAVTLPFALDLRDKARLSTVGMMNAIYGPTSGPWNQAFSIGDAVQAKADPGEKLYVIGSEAEFYWASGVEPASRWLFEYPSQVAPERFAPDIRRMCEDPPEFLVHTGGPIGRSLHGCIRGNVGKLYGEFARSGGVVAYERLR